MKEIFLDTETTGLSFNEGHRIVEIACIETQDLVATGKVFPAATAAICRGSACSCKRFCGP